MQLLQRNGLHRMHWQLYTSQRTQWCQSINHALPIQTLREGCLLDVDRRHQQLESDTPYVTWLVAGAFYQRLALAQQSNVIMTCLRSGASGF